MAVTLTCHVLTYHLPLLATYCVEYLVLTTLTRYGMAIAITSGAATCHLLCRVLTTYHPPTRYGMAVAITSGAAIFKLNEEVRSMRPRCITLALSLSLSLTLTLTLTLALALALSLRLSLSLALSLALALTPSLSRSLSLALTLTRYEEAGAMQVVSHARHDPKSMRRQRT